MGLLAPRREGGREAGRGEGCTGGQEGKRGYREPGVSKHLLRREALRGLFAQHVLDEVFRCGAHGALASAPSACVPQ